MKGYKSFSRSRVNGAMGGVATSVIESDAKDTLKVTEGKNSNEFLITRHGQFVIPLNIINVYGDVESRTAKEVTDEKWDEIIQEVVKIEARAESVLIIGDMNKHLGSYVDKNNKKTNTRRYKDY